MDNLGREMDHCREIEAERLADYCSMEERYEYNEKHKKIKKDDEILDEFCIHTSYGEIGIIVVKNYLGKIKIMIGVGCCFGSERRESILKHGDILRPELLNILLNYYNKGEK